MCAQQVPVDSGLQSCDSVSGRFVRETGHVAARIPQDGRTIGKRHVQLPFQRRGPSSSSRAHRSGRARHAHVEIELLLTDGPAAGLTVHHTIEERYIFPILGKRMQHFADDDVHLKSHEAIHHGAFPAARGLRGCRF